VADSTEDDVGGFAGIGRSGLEACIAARYIKQQTYPPKRSGPEISRDGMSRDVGASGSRDETRVSPIAIARIAPELGSSTTSITAVSTGDDASCACGSLRPSGRSRASVISSANVFAVFHDFLPMPHGMFHGNACFA
jgi:hypothetical protein